MRLHQLEEDANKFPYTLDKTRCTGTPLIASSVGFVSDVRLGGRQDVKRRRRFAV